MNTIRVRHVTGDQFAITCRGHTIGVDQPVSDGGSDSAPTPTELFVASLSSCVAFYAHRYLTRHQLPVTGLTVTGHYTMASRPARVAEISIDIEAPALPVERRDALLAVASHCTVHNSPTDPPDIVVSVTGNALPLEACDASQGA